MSFSDAPRQSFRLIRHLIPRSLQPTLRGLRKSWQRRKLKLEEPYYTVFPFTQVSQARQQNLLRLCEIIERESIPGAVVECGVCDGGTSGLMALGTAKSARPVHMFDAWSGLPKTTAEDTQAGKQWEGQVVGSPKRVAECMEHLHIDPKRLTYHTGWFHETFPHATIDQIALLHIDCDFHDPTALCLDTWYPKVVPGGFIQFDDYESFVGCRTAVDKFLAQTGLQLQTFGERGKAYYVQKK